MKGTTIFTMTALCAALVCCSKEETSTPPAPEGEHMLTLVASSQTETDAAPESRTEIGDDGKTVLWIDGKEQVKLLETAEGVTINKTTGYGKTTNGGKTMSFQIWLDVRTETGPYLYHAVYPNYACSNSENNPAVYPVTTKSAQTPTVKSFDPQSDLLISKPFELESRPGSGGKVVGLRFRRLVAVGKLTIKGLQTSEPVQKVEFSAPGKALAGISVVDFTSDKVAYGTSNTSEKVVLDYSALGVTADQALTTYFTCLPFELNAGDTFVLTVSTASAVFTKTVTVVAGREIRFKAGGFSSFTVNMSGIGIFGAEKAWLDGPAVAARTALEKPVENANLYAWCGELAAGETLTIPVEYEGTNYFIVPADPRQAMLGTGAGVAAKMSETEASWTVPSDGVCRLILDLEKREVRSYTSQNDLTPLTVTFRPNGSAANPEATIEVVNKLYLYGEGTGWGVKTVAFTPSLADPQVLIYDATVSGTTYKGKIKFCISKSFTAGDTSYNQNNSYCFTCPLKDDGTAQTLSLTLGEESTLHGGSGAERNSYYTVPAADLLILDLRNGTILVRNK